MTDYNHGRLDIAARKKFEHFHILLETIYWQSFIEIRDAN